MTVHIFLGIDIGYGFTKTFNSGGGKMFPTAVTTMILRSTFRKSRRSRQTERNSWSPKTPCWKGNGC